MSSPPVPVDEVFGPRRVQAGRKPVRALLGGDRPDRRHARRIRPHRDRAIPAAPSGLSARPARRVREVRVVVKATDVTVRDRAAAAIVSIRSVLSGRVGGDRAGGRPARRRHRRSAGPRPRGRPGDPHGGRRTRARARPAMCSPSSRRLRSTSAALRRRGGDPFMTMFKPPVLDQLLDQTSGLRFFEVPLADGIRRPEGERADRALSGCSPNCAEMPEKPPSRTGW